MASQGSKAPASVKPPANSLRGVGIPIKLLHEAEGHVVTIELKTGEQYRGTLADAEDDWNCQLRDITATAKDGQLSKLESAFVRGSQIRYLIIPDMLKNAPMFKRLEGATSKGKQAVKPQQQHKRKRQQRQ